MGKYYKRTISFILLIMFIVLLPMPAKAIDTDYTLEDGRRVAIPLTYKCEKMITFLGGEAGFMNKPEDIFIDDNDMLYVADTENNRILKMDSSGKVSNIFTGPYEGKNFNKPMGVYVDKDGDIYVADTSNERIVHLSPEGRFVEQFTKPASKLMDPNFTFDPAKIYISSIGYIYILNRSNYAGLVTIDAKNEFRGYVGATQVGFNLIRSIVRMFATEEQKKRIAQPSRPPYANFVIGNDGLIYATVVNTNNNQIVKLNSVGKNIYPEGFYGEMSPEGLMPRFADIAVDNDGIISTLDVSTRKIYQYDPEGNLLTVFGQEGEREGEFQSPTSLAIDSKGRIYVLDSLQNALHVFQPTNFINLIHEATILYSNGNYEEAKQKWEQVLKIDANYRLAHRGMGKALFKEEQWRESMAEYKEGEDVAGYSKAFAEYRHQLFRDYFGWLIVVIIVIIAAIFKLVDYLHRRAATYINRFITWEGNL